METRENYLLWLSSDSKTIRGLAFQAALVNKIFPWEKLFTDYSELIERNLLWALKKHPELWDDFISAVEKMQKPPVKLMCEIVAMVSFYLCDEDIDIKRAIDLIANYEPESQDAGELVIALLIGMQRENCWQAIAMKKAQKVDASIEQVLLSYLKDYGCPYANVMVVLDVIVDVVDYPLKAKIINSLLQNYGISHEVIAVVCSYIEEYWQGLPIFMSYLIDWVNSDEPSLVSCKMKIMNCIFSVLTSHSLQLPQNQRRLLFSAADWWMQEDVKQACLTLDKYMQIYPEDRLKVLRLYNQVLNKTGSQGVWFDTEKWKYFDWKPQLILSILDDERYFKILRRHGSKKELTMFYMELLRGSVCDFPQYAKKSIQCLKLMEEVSYLSGNIMDFLPELESFLQKSTRVKSFVNAFIDLILTKNCAQNKLSTDDLKKIDAFCLKYELKARKFYTKFAFQLSEIKERQEQEDKIIRRLKAELNF